MGPQSYGRVLPPFFPPMIRDNLFAKGKIVVGGGGGRMWEKGRMNDCLLEMNFLVAIGNIILVAWDTVGFSIN